MSPGALPSSGPGFPIGMSFPQILGIQLKVHSPSQDGVLLSRWSLFCLFPPSKVHIKNNLDYSIIYMKRQKTQISKTTLKKKKWKETIYPISRFIIQLLLGTSRGVDPQINCTEQNLEIDSHKLSLTALLKGRAIQWKKGSFFQEMVQGQLYIHRQKSNSSKVSHIIKKGTQKGSCTYM